MAKCVLIVDDDPTQRRILEETVKRFSYEILTAANGEEALAVLNHPDTPNVSVVLLDLVMPDLDGMGVLDRMRTMRAKPPVIVQTANGSIDAAIGAMKAGADDFVVKPVSPERLEVSIKNALRITQLEGEITRIKRKSAGVLTFADFITTSETMDRVIDLGRRASQSNIPVLIEGESGVGKELIALAVQGESARAGKPFITVNCGAIPENLVESTLFGHEKGAFTGAVEKRTGKFVEADGGTLFLDEISELPLDAQVKLLRALQDGEVDAVGGKCPIKIDFRLISATNQDLIKQVHDGKFREDLYYRLNVFPIWVPPLRERSDDIPDLVNHFIARFSSEEGKRIRSVETDTIEMLRLYPWPGNVRQLENAVFRAVVLADGPTLNVNAFPQIAAQVEDFEAEVPPAPTPMDTSPQFVGPAMLGDETPVPPTIAVPDANGRDALGIVALDEAGDIRPLDDIEADMIRLAIGRYRGRMTEIAKKLGIGRSTLYRKMREFGLEVRAR